MFANLTEETATNNGVIFTLTGITDTSIPFGASFVDGQKVHYVAHGNNGKCAGIGTYNSGANTITQDDVWQWTPGGGVVEYPASNLTLTGTVVVYCDVFAVDNRLALFEDDTDLALQVVKPTISLNFRDNKFSIYDGFANSYIDAAIGDILTIDNGAATGVDAIGLLRESSVDSARLVFDPVTGESLGLLHEVEKIGKAKYSKDFSNAIWSKARAVIDPNVAIAPDGTMTASRLRNNGLIDGIGYISQNLTWTGVAENQAIFAKADSITEFTISFTDSGGYSANGLLTINLLTGAIVGGSYSPALVEIVPYSNGWFRISFSVTPLAGVGSIRILLPSDLTAGTDGIFIWQHDSTEGLFASSPIYTGASTVTRLVDKYYRTLGNEFNPLEGTFVFYGVLSGLNSAGSAMICVSDGTNNNRITLRFDSTGKPAAYIANGGVATVNQTIDAGYVVGTPFIAAMSFKANSCILSFNGVSVEDTSVTIPSGLNQFAIGRLASGLTTEIYTGTIAETHYAPKAESAAVLNAITSGVLTYD